MRLARLLRPSFSLFRLAFLAVGLTFAVPGHAGPREDLRAALLRFLAQTSFQGDVQAKVGTHVLPSKVEFQAPDRFRISREGRVTALIVGRQMYLMLHGRTIRAPMPAAVDAYRDPAMIERLEGHAPVQDLGLETVNGTRSHKYRVMPDSESPSEVTLWIGVASGLPVQVQTLVASPEQSIYSTIEYSHYGDPNIRIEMPH